MVLLLKSHFFYLLIYVYIKMNWKIKNEIFAYNFIWKIEIQNCTRKLDLIC